MRLQGYDSVFTNRARGTSPAGGRKAGTSFLDQLKSAASAAAPEQAVDVLELTKTDEGLRDLLPKLTPASRDVLDRMEAGKKDVSPDEWTALCKELEALGAITEEDFQSTRADFHIIPFGYEDENGNFVQYDMSMLTDELLNLYYGQRPGADGLWACLNADSWRGDPLAYLDNWMESLYSWRSDMARAKNEDGTQKFDNFSPITNRINSCQKVADLVKALWKCEEGAGL